jgi:hypothetical protein
MITGTTLYPLATQLTTMPAPYKGKMGHFCNLRVPSQHKKICTSCFWMSPEIRFQLIFHDGSGLSWKCNIISFLIWSISGCLVLLLTILWCSEVNDFHQEFDIFKKGSGMACSSVISRHDLACVSEWLSGVEIVCLDLGTCSFFQENGYHVPHQTPPRGYQWYLLQVPQVPPLSFSPSFTPRVPSHFKWLGTQ